MKPSPPKVMTWEKKLWNKVTDRCVASALQAAHMDKQCLFKESFTAEHQRLGPKFLKEIDPQKFRLEFGVGELYAPEDNMAVCE